MDGLDNLLQSELIERIDMLRYIDLTGLGDCWTFNGKYDTKYIQLGKVFFLVRLSTYSGSGLPGGVVSTTCESKVKILDGHQYNVLETAPASPGRYRSDPGGCICGEQQLDESCANLDWEAKEDSQEGLRAPC